MLKDDLEILFVNPLNSTNIEIKKIVTFENINRINVCKREMMIEESFAKNIKLCNDEKIKLPWFQC